MAQKFTGSTHPELDAFVDKNVNLFNIHQYNLPAMRRKVNKNEKEAQAKNKIKKEEDNEEKENENESILLTNSKSKVPIYSEYLEDEEKTEPNTNEQKNENKEEEVIIDVPLFDPAWAYEMRPNSDILSEDKFYEGVSEVETNK